MFLLVLWCILFAHTGLATTPESDPNAVSPMTAEKAIQLAEKFGVDVGEVDEEIKELLGLNKAEGVVVFAVIGGSPAELSGIKVKAVIKEVDIFEIRTLVDLGNALEKTMSTPNFTVATYEPMSGVGVTGGLNFHFVRILQD
ncbi:MAG: PDZ domain-containing protein [Nitrospirota bacterium]|nr:PDZ domain-containing protein [Nitrospirota bacterium]MDH5587616.1 PDZ domain-containing protein [Nitrospirota bacterium]MDH5773942.1 PDZ domain-containing protein [Nitrospirota bacterium]